VDFARNYYIVGFEPNATMETAHHMLVYGCSKPGSTKPVWNCGEMANAGSNSDTAPACKEGTQVINTKIYFICFSNFINSFYSEKNCLFVYVDHLCMGKRCS